MKNESFTSPIYGFITPKNEGNVGFHGKMLSFATRSVRHWDPHTPRPKVPVSENCSGGSIYSMVYQRIRQEKDKKIS